MRITADTSSTDDALSTDIIMPESNAQPIAATKAKPEHRPDDRITKLAQAKEGKEQKKGAQSRKPVTCDFNFVYVGNLQSTITTSLLESFFKDCGQIQRAIIRCSGGQVVTPGLAISKEVLGPRDRRYASIEFANSQSASKALAYDGKDLDGSKLVVSASVADLPECQDLVQSWIAETQKQNDPKPPPRNIPQRPLISHPTGRFTDFRDPKNDRHHILGISFPKGII